MKTALAISVCVNLLLAAVLSNALRSRPEVRPEAAPALRTGAVAGASALAASPAPLAKAGSEHFHWSQLESTDYRVYVANLRATGCPEQTVRDIIMMDVNHLYSDKRRQLNLDGNGTGEWSRGEEEKLVASLLGEPPVSEPSGQRTAAAQADKVATAPLPLIFQPVDLDASGLESGQKQAIAELRGQFIAEIGGLDQDPSDPAYLARWQKALKDLDETLPGMIGRKAFLEFQLQAANAAATGRAANR
jgi:hypothetical protein